MLRRLVLGSVAGLAALAGPALAQGTCPNRGQLDELYCDANGDLVADAPSDPTKLRDPSTLVFAYTPVEDPAVYQNIFKPLTEHLGRCTGKRVVYYPVQSNSAEIEAMRSGRLHIAGFSTGPTGFAVNMAGAVPFAAKGTAEQVRGYQLAMVVKKDSPYQSRADLKGKKIAHTAPSSNSGHLAPLALFPEQGLKPGADYQPVFSGGHDKTILGVRAGDYDAGPVASDVFDRMITRGTVKADDFRVIYKSAVFPTSSFAYAHDLKPELAAKIKQCFYDFRFTPEMTKEFNGDDRSLPIVYQKDWAIVRKVAEDSERPTTRPPTRKRRPARPRRRARRPRDSRSNDGRAGGRRGDGEGDSRALLIRKLRKEYRPGVPVLKDIELAIPGRGMTAVIGPSGTGKSTLIRCINRLVEPTAGEILFRGQDLAKLSGLALRQARRRIGMVFQEYNLVERLTVMENLLCGRLGYVAAWRAWLRRFPRGDVERAFDLLDAVGLSGFATRRADALSGGQRQRVGIAGDHAAARHPPGRRADLVAGSEDLGRDQS